MFAWLENTFFRTWDLIQNGQNHDLRSQKVTHFPSLSHDFHVARTCFLCCTDTVIMYTRPNIYDPLPTYSHIPNERIAKKGYIYEQDEVIIALLYQSEQEKGLPSTATHTQGQVRIALSDQKRAPIHRDAHPGPSIGDKEHLEQCQLRMPSVVWMYQETRRSNERGATSTSWRYCELSVVH